MPVLPSVTAAIGGTPLVRLARLAAGCPATILVKVEAANPGGSAKDRVGVALLDDADRRGVLFGREIIEPTSGNTGIALALAAAARGLKLTLTMPEGATPERRRLLAAFGAKLILTPDREGMAGSVRRAEALAAADPEKYFLPQQFRNPANPAAHEAGTGPEIWAAAGGAVDALVAAVGTGGTLTGTARFLKKVSPALTAVAVEPAASPVITQFLAGQTLSPAPHAIPGIGAGFVPENLDLRIVDRVETVTDEEAASTARRLAREEGLLAGPSSGAAVAAALRLAREPAFAGRTIVAVLPDSGERYLSAGLFDG